MKKMIKDLTVSDKCSILFVTFFKILRGFFIKIFLKKSRGLLFVGKNVNITHKKYISVGKNVKFEEFSEIQGLSKKGLVFGNNVTIGRFSMIRPSSYYGIDIGAGLKIGDNSSIGPMAYVGCAGYVEIGDNVMIGPKVSILPENHNFSEKEVNIKEQGVNQKGIRIEDNVWIGCNVTILDGVTIGKGAIIGAGCLISKSIPPYSKVIDKRNKIIENR